MNIDCNKKYINKRGDMYFDITREFDLEDSGTCLLYKARTLHGWRILLNEKGEAVSNVAKNHKHEKGTLDCIKEYQPNSILQSIEVVLRGIVWRIM